MNLRLWFVIPSFTIALAAALVGGCGRTSLRQPSDGGVGFDGRPPSDAGCTSSSQCDDGLVCNGAEACIAGVCAPGRPLDCTDGVDCTVDGCDEATAACVHRPDPRLCGDEELCDPTRGCVTVPCSSDIDCDDGLVCDGFERCAGGSCRAGVPLSCEDGNPCTDDRCEEALGGCVSSPRDADRDGFGDAACGGTDCDDARPAIHPGAAELCDDRLDNDCNGAIDCADRACAGSPICTCAPIEDCGSGRDADCDGLIGCADPDCATRPECTTCMPVDLGRRVGAAVATGTTTGISRLAPPCGSPGGAAPEAIFRWTAPSDGTFTFDTFGSVYDTVLYLRAACSGPDIPGGCNDDTGGLQSRVTVSLAAGQTIVIVVDGFGSSAGSYVLNINAGGVEICDNGTDDDGDGLADCADPDCAGDPRCCAPRMEVCTNGMDDDCDRLVDCGDPDCRFSPSCCVPSPEVCTDGRDNDCDMRVDCADPDCFGTPACCVPSPEVCTDGRDNDCDMRVDCADPDCFGTPACCVPSPEVCTDGRDNDCDMRVDCADPDCATNPACVPCPDADIGSRLGRRVVVGSTVGGPNRFTPSCATSTAPDRSYMWTAPISGDFFIDTFGSTYDTMLTLHTSCTGPELPGMCNDDVPGMGTQSRLRVTLRAGARVLIVVDGWASSSGSFVLNISRAFPDETGLCSDGLDNDGDLAIDCADSDCAMDTACAP